MWRPLLKTYGVQQQGYRHLVVATMAVVMFGGMCRYDDVSNLRWKHATFGAAGCSVELFFEKRKNDQHRQGGRVLVSAVDVGDVCPVKLLLQLRAATGPEPESYIFRGFEGRLVAKSPGAAAPGEDRITYSQLIRYMALWFGQTLGLTPKEFRKEFGTQSGRSGGASAAANAGVPYELWGQHGVWNSRAQRSYMQRDTTSLMSVSAATMELRAFTGSEPPPEEALEDEDEDEEEEPAPPDGAHASTFLRLLQEP